MLNIEIDALHHREAEWLSHEIIFVCSLASRLDTEVSMNKKQSYDST
jgi:hypothetical protein